VFRSHLEVVDVKLFGSRAPKEPIRDIPMSDRTIRMSRMMGGTGKDRESPDSLATGRPKKAW